MLPTVKPLLGVFIEWQALRLQLIILVMRTILCNQFVDNLLPLDFQLFRSFSVVPPAFQDRFGHHEKNTVYETVTRTLALDQFAQNLLLDGTDNGDIGTSDKNGTLRTLAVGNRRLGIEHRKPELFFRTVVVTVEILEPGRQLVRPKAESSGILGMYQAQSFGSDIRNKKASAHGSLRKLIQTGFHTFLFAHGHSAFILGIQLLILLILTVIVLNKRLESKTQRMTLIRSGASNQCHVQNRTFQPVALHLHQMGVANPHGNGCKDSRSNIIHGIALTIVQTADDTLNPDRKDFYRELTARHLGSDAHSLADNTFCC